MESNIHVLDGIQNLVLELLQPHTSAICKQYSKFNRGLKETKIHLPKNEWWDH